MVGVLADEVAVLSPLMSPAAPPLSVVVGEGVRVVVFEVLRVVLGVVFAFAVVFPFLVVVLRPVVVRRLVVDFFVVDIFVVVLTVNGAAFDEVVPGATERCVVSVVVVESDELAETLDPELENESEKSEVVGSARLTELEVERPLAWADDTAVVELRGVVVGVVVEGATDPAVDPVLTTAALALLGQPVGVPMGYCEVAEATKFRVEGSLVDTTGPGLGNPILVCSVDPQPDGRSVAARLATKSCGRLCIWDVSEAPPLMAMAAQFICLIVRTPHRSWSRLLTYISRLPIVLNQVQAKVACPFIIPDGMLNWN